MTLVEITYELQAPLGREHLGRLAEFANTYGLRGFRVDEQNRRLTLEYDASRLKETQVSNLLRSAKIPILQRVSLIPENPPAA